MNYTVSSSSLSAVNIKITENIMKLQGRKWGASTIMLTAADGKGGSITSQIKINVWFLTYLLPALLAVLLILLAAGLLIKRKIARDNISPAGQLLITVKDEETGSMSSDEYIDISDFKGAFSVFEILRLNPANEETRKVMLKAKDDQTLILTNNSQCTIESNGTEIDATKGHLIKLNDTIEVITPERKQIVSMKYCWRSMVIVESLFKDGI